MYRTVDELRRREGRGRGGGRRDQADQHDRPATSPDAASTDGPEVAGSPEAAGSPGAADEADVGHDDVAAVDSGTARPRPRRGAPPVPDSRLPSGSGIRFAGRVVDVDTQNREDHAPPPVTPLMISATLLAAAAVLPVAVRLLPALVLVATLLLLVRPRRVLRLPRRRRRAVPVTRLQSHSFSLRLTGETGPGAVLPCRLLTRTGPDSPPPLLGGEYVKGNGRRRSGNDTVEVRELVVESGSTFTTARLRSPFPLMAASAAMVLAAVALVAVRRERIQELASDQLVPSLAAAVVPVVLFCAFMIYRRRGRRRS